ncbi:hypothetical protein EGJ00_14285 [Pseudomonas saudiphocaensis]|nr:hypothetical protein EGJ00_14285 [Pseudomonas saudiphocaensis]
MFFDRPVEAKRLHGGLIVGVGAKDADALPVFGHRCLEFHEASGFKLLLDAVRCSLSASSQEQESYEQQGQGARLPYYRPLSSEAG